MEQNNSDASAGAEDYSPDSKYGSEDGESSTPGGAETDRPKRFQRDKPGSFGDSRRRPDRGGRGRREGGGPRHGGRRPHPGFQEEPQEVDARIQEMIDAAEARLSASHQPITLENLTPFERKQIHQHFERRKMMYETKTYRRGEDHVLWVFPVANLKKFAESKAKEALDRGEEIALPPMSNYERFIVHNLLKEFGSVETLSAGDGDNRHIVIQPKKFGRSLRKIAKKIKLF